MAERVQFTLATNEEIFPGESRTTRRITKTVACMRIWLAIRVFFLVLFSGEAARKVQSALAASAAPAKSPAESDKPTSAPVASKPAPAKPKPQRSEALTLLAMLQREARLVDFLQESLAGYEDAQIGAAVRDIHRDAAATLKRLFALSPLSTEGEGASIEVPAGFDPARYQLTGNVSGQAPFRGQLTHHGWQATRCELPEWHGTASAALIVAPTEVEIQ